MEYVHTPIFYPCDTCGARTKTLEALSFHTERRHLLDHGRWRQNHQQKLSVAICWCYQKPSRGLQKWAAECWFSCEPDGDALTTGQVGKINRQSIHRTNWVRLCRAFSSLVLKIEQLQGWDTGLMEYVTIELIEQFKWVYCEQNHLFKILKW